MRSISISLLFLFLSRAIAAFHLKWVYSSVVNVFSPWKSSRGESGRKRDRNSSFYGHTTSLALVAQRTCSVIPPMMSAAPLKASSPTNTHRPPPSIFIVFRLQCCISWLLLAPHTQGTPKQKSILSIGQCHHNYSFETAIENKLHLHCVFIRLLWVSNAHSPFPAAPTPTNTRPSIALFRPQRRAANNGAGVHPEGGSRHMTAVKEKAT